MPHGRFGEGFDVIVWVWADADVRGKMLVSCGLMREPGVRIAAKGGVVGGGGHARVVLVGVLDGEDEGGYVGEAVHVPREGAVAAGLLLFKSRSVVGAKR